MLVNTAGVPSGASSGMALVAKKLAVGEGKVSVFSSLSETGTKATL